MNRPLLALILLTFAAHTQAASPALEKRLADLKQAYEAAVERQAGTATNTAIRALDAKYTAALDRLITSSTQAGKLEDAIALRDEKKRVSNGLPLPADDSDATEALKPLRGTYRSQLAEIEATREKQINPLKERYLQELTKLQTDTTKTGNLEDALAVKTIIDGMGKAASPSQAPDEFPDKPVIAKGNGKTDPKAAQAICEWALANGAVVTTDQGKVGANEKLKATPSGRFSVQAINAEHVVSSFPWNLLPSLSELKVLAVNISEPITSEHTASLSNLPLLTDLILVGELSVEALHALPMNSRLNELAINATGKSEDLTPAIKELIRRFPAVTKLNWGSDGQEISPEAAKELSRWPRVKILNTKGDLSAPVVEALSEMPSLIHIVCLGGGTIDPTHIPKLVDLDYLNVSYGKYLPGLSEAVTKLPHLKTLRLPMRGRRVEDILPLSQCKSLIHLTLRLDDAAVPTDDFAPFLNSLTRLVELELLGSDLTDTGLSRLSGLKSLELLIMPGTKVTDGGLLALAPMKSLRQLEVQNTAITEAGIKALKKLLPKCEVIR